MAQLSNSFGEEGEEFLMSTFSKHEVLVVDDEEAVRDSLGLLLQSAGYDVSMATNGFDALLQLKRSVPTVLLSDLNMPQMSGFESYQWSVGDFPRSPSSP
jgi:CheY-like chemotaxis protein